VALWVLSQLTLKLSIFQEIYQASGLIELEAYYSFNL